MIIETATAMEQLGMSYAEKISGGMMVFLKGELGAGKTTLVRGMLRGFGYEGTVKSPTYTLVESYNLQGIVLHHFDLYRLTSPYELEEMGFRDYGQKDAIVLIEWPEKAQGYLPEAQVTIEIAYHDLGRLLHYKKQAEKR